MNKKLFLLYIFFISLSLQAQNFVKSIISSNQTGGIYGVLAKDLDNDGDLDLMSASQTDNTLAYYINDGTGNFTQHVLSDSGGLINLPGAISIDGADFDDDGDIDFVACGTSELVWYEDVGGIFSIHPIESGLNNPLQVRLYDIGGILDPATPDGDMDIGILRSGDNQASVYMNYNNSFTRFDLVNVIQPKYLHGGDFDSNNTDDLVITSYGNNEIKWYKLIGASFVAGGTVASNFSGAFGVEGGDLDVDGDDDVVATAFLGNEIAWFENSDGTGTNFVKHSVDTALTGASYVHWVDIDNDGDKDFVAAGYGNASGNTTTGHEMVIYYNDGNMNFTKYVIDNTEAGPANFMVADFNGDGALDIVFAANKSNRLVLLTNNTLGITETQNQTLKIFPNPARLAIQIASDEPVDKVAVFDLTGRKVLETKAIRLPLQNFRKGYYLMHIYLSNGKEVFRKFLVK